MLNRFVNFDNLISNKSTTLGRVIPDDIIKSITYNEGLIQNYSVSDCTLDIHLYNDSLDFIDSLYNQTIEFDPEYNDFYYNISRGMFESGINSGLVRGCLNFSLNLFGNSSFKPLILKEVSSDLTELKLVLDSQVKADYPSIKDQFKEFDSLVSLLKDSGRINNLVVNFGSNNIQSIVNIKLDCSDDYVIYIKLLNTLIDEITANDLCYISFKLCEDYIDSFLVSPVEVEIKPNVLSGPNFNIPFEQEGGDATEFKSWDSILNANASTNNDIVLEVLSGSNSVDLNIDYTSFSNFVFYGSAQERLKNYDYKRRLIEHYNSQIISSSVSDSDYGVVNNLDFTNKVENIKTTFDGFERFLHYRSGSLFTHDITGSITPAPKYISGSDVVNYATTASQYTTWYNSLISSSIDYDRENNNRLYEYTPGHIVNDSNNSEYFLFLDMIGHHFDNLYAYVKELTSIHEKDDHPERGIPNQLLRDYAESLGWDVRNGYQLSELWLYKLGKDSSGSLADVSTLPSKAHENLSHQIWRRIVNNLPFLLKTKGTARSVKALMSSYGIPKTLISIKEYGGPVTSGFSSYKETNTFNYSLVLGGDQYVQLDRLSIDKNGDSVYTAPGTVEFRFKTDVTSSASMSLWAIEDRDSRDNVFHNLELIPTASYSGSSIYGYLKYTGTYESASSYYTSSVVSEYLPLFDNDSWDVQIQTQDLLSDSILSSSIDFNVQKVSDYTNNRISFSSSFSWTPGGDISYTFGGSTDLTSSGHYVLLGGSTGSSQAGTDSSRFIGNVQFYREYENKVDKSIFDDHTLNPSSYTSDDYSSSFEDVLRYFPLGGDVIRYNHTGSTIVTSSHPDRNYINNSSYATMVGFTGSQSDQYESNNETYYTKIPSTGANIVKNNKVRIESNNLNGVTLSPTKRVEDSEFDRSSKDGNRLVIAYSPTDQINNDIYNQFGYFSLDNILGNPKDQETSKYSGFESFRQNYWKKYTTKNNYNKYIEVFSLFDFSFFDQIKQLAPARANLISGVLLENNILERPRIERKQPSISFTQLSDELLVRTDEQSGKFVYYSASLDPEKELEISKRDFTSSLEYEKELEITHTQRDTNLNISKSLFIDKNSYTGSIEQVQNIGLGNSVIYAFDNYVNGGSGTISDIIKTFETLDFVSGSKVLKYHGNNSGSITTFNYVIIGSSVYPNAQGNRSSISLIPYTIDTGSFVISHNNSGSLISGIYNIYNQLQGDSILSGVVSNYSSGSVIKGGILINNNLTSSIYGLEFNEEEKTYSFIRSGSLYTVTRVFNKNNKYEDVIQIPKRELYVLDQKIEDKVGFLDSFDYNEFYSGSSGGPYILSSSLLDVTSSFTKDKFIEYLDKNNYYVDSVGDLYRSNSKGKVCVYISGSRVSNDYKTYEYFYSSSSSNKYREGIDIAVSMSNNNYYSSSLKDTSYQYEDDSVFNRIRFMGSKLTGPDINVDTINTIDGGPVVSIRTVESEELRV